MIKNLFSVMAGAALLAMPISLRAADQLSEKPVEIIKVAAGTDRLFALTADSQVAMFDRNTLAANFPGPLTSTRIKQELPNLDAVTAIAVRPGGGQLLIAGTLNDMLLGKVMFIQAWTPAGWSAPTNPPTQPVPTPWVLLWTYTGNIPVSGVTAVTGSGSPQCVYGAGWGPRTVNGVATFQGLIVKLTWGGVFHWSQYVEDGAAQSRVTALSAYGGYSNVQAAGNIISGGVSHAFLQVFAESGGYPGPRHIWPENSSLANSVVAVPGKGVFVYGSVTVPLHPYVTDTQHILRRYTFDGSLRVTSTFTEPLTPAPFRRLAAGMGYDLTGIWTASNLEPSPVGTPSRLFLRHVAYDLSTVLSTRFLNQPTYFLRDLTARDNAAYGGGLVGTTTGFLLRSDAP